MLKVVLYDQRKDLHGGCVLLESSGSQTSLKDLSRIPAAQPENTRI
jgi:hypothetical protein